MQVNPGETFTIRAEDGSLQCIQGQLHQTLYYYYINMWPAVTWRPSISHHIDYIPAAHAFMKHMGWKYNLTVARKYI